MTYDENETDATDAWLIGQEEAQYLERNFQQYPFLVNRDSMLISMSVE